MDADDMRDADWAILKVLRDGRANAPLIAERAEYSAQYVRERLGRLKQDGIVEPLGHGMYRVN
jgi:DNA-binding Lrp family transcriptional regulator